MGPKILQSVLLLSLGAAAYGGCAATPDANTGTGGSSGSSGSSGNAGTGAGKSVGPTIILPGCGDGTVVSPEECDDGNKNPGDGCNGACRVEADHTCPPAGGACTSNAICGDGLLATTEVCDDTNTNPGDGCAADCKSVETGWQCRAPGKKCVPFCGDRMLTGTENCDDGDAESGDGCSSTCLTEPGWSCDPATGVCTQSACGDGVQQAGESCDKGMENGLFYGDGTGCSKTCTAEPSCRDASGTTTACTTHCGDANVDAGESCDDGNALGGDGCSATCTVEDGFTCTPEARPDTSPCANGVGECLTLPITYRDFDGENLATGHPDFFFRSASRPCIPNASGTGPTGTRPNGSNCWVSDATALCSGLASATLGPGGKPTLNAGRAGGPVCGCRFTDWDATNVIPAMGAGVSSCTDGAASPSRIETTTRVIRDAASFAQWYTDSTFSTKVLGALELAPTATVNQFQFSSGRDVYDDIHDIFLRNGVVTSLSSGFFPLEGTNRPKVCNLWPYWTPGTNCIAADGNPVSQQWDVRGWYGDPMYPPAAADINGGPVKPVTGMMRNFYFTTEVRYLFNYAGGESLQFYGDDDVWVFINGRLVLDLGAPHERLQGTVTLTGTGATWTIQSENPAAQTFTQVGTGSVTGLNLEVGRIYEIAVFHADRQPRESNYQLTVSGFSTTRSACTPTCGDGVATPTEECDDGAANQDGLYGGCTTQCKFGPFCGDMVVSDGEECDLGAGNASPIYGTPGSGCTAACKLPHFCGDAVIDSAFGEECDDGTNNGVGQCTTSCQLEAE